MGHLITFKAYRNHYIPVLFCLFLLSQFGVYAQGNLLISPKRIVFEGNKKTQEINLANTGKDTAKYLISTMEIRMKADGGFEEITQPDANQFFASRFLRFYPRTVILAPNESQVIKVQLTKTSELTEAEYRSHIYFRAIPNEKALGEKDTVKEQNAISVQLTPVFGISIPVIIRNGASTTQTTITDCAVKMSPENKPMLVMTINRTGNMSVYGDIHVEHIDAAGKKTNAGMAKGVAVYTPNPIRTFQFELSNTTLDYTKGKLQITYGPSEDVKSNVKTYSETTISLN
ncbi:hypothetical protein CAP35_08820 [Chitinophagaceae bacterium IBVUCB1]|nr:hypothetical protein CAP35_08820 [Chitinophagaceae bacterium IBVUCB1]